MLSPASQALRGRLRPRLYASPASQALRGRLRCKLCRGLLCRLIVSKTSNYLHLKSKIRNFVFTILRKIAQKRELLKPNGGTPIADPAFRTRLNHYPLVVPLG
jgi:hypothetical protein